MAHAGSDQGCRLFDPLADGLRGAGSAGPVDRAAVLQAVGADVGDQRGQLTQASVAGVARGIGAYRLTSRDGESEIVQAVVDAGHDVIDESGLLDGFRASSFSTRLEPSRLGGDGDALAVPVAPGLRVGIALLGSWERERDLQGRLKP